MKAVVQRVSGASVTVDGEIKGKIGKGFLVFLGVGKKDSELNAERLANKIIKMRIFSDENDKINLIIKRCRRLFACNIAVYTVCRLPKGKQT